MQRPNVHDSRYGVREGFPLVRYLVQLKHAVRQLRRCEVVL